eukprot:scaffold1964_cov252-Isochrysis_galbana.AAC.16
MCVCYVSVYCAVYVSAVPLAAGLSCLGTPAWARAAACVVRRAGTSTRYAPNQQPTFQQCSAVAVVYSSAQCSNPVAERTRRVTARARALARTRTRTTSHARRTHACQVKRGLAHSCISAACGSMPSSCLLARHNSCAV